jgi:hypothetical protein
MKYGLNQYLTKIFSVSNKILTNKQEHAISNLL